RPATVPMKSTEAPKVGCADGASLPKVAPTKGVTKVCALAAAGAAMIPALKMAAVRNFRMSPPNNPGLDAHEDHKSNRRASVESDASQRHGAATNPIFGSGWARQDHRYDRRAQTRHHRLSLCRRG